MKLQDKDFAKVDRVQEDEVCPADIAAEFMVALGSILVFLGAVILAVSW